MAAKLHDRRKITQLNILRQKSVKNNLMDDYLVCKESDKAEEKKGAGKKKNKVKTIDLPIDSSVPQLSRDALNLLTEKEVSYSTLSFAVIFFFIAVCVN